LYVPPPPCWAGVMLMCTRLVQKFAFDVLLLRHPANLWELRVGFRRHTSPYLYLLFLFSPKCSTISNFCEGWRFDWAAQRPSPAITTVHQIVRRCDVRRDLPFDPPTGRRSDLAIYVLSSYPPLFWYVCVFPRAVPRMVLRQLSLQSYSF
jgi:hypothetical protein